MNKFAMSGIIRFSFVYSKLMKRFKQCKILLKIKCKHTFISIKWLLEMQPFLWKQYRQLFLSKVQMLSSRWICRSVQTLLFVLFDSLRRELNKTTTIFDTQAPKKCPLLLKSEVLSNLGPKNEQNNCLAVFSQSRRLSVDMKFATVRWMWLVTCWFWGELSNSSAKQKKLFCFAPSFSFEKQFFFYIIKAIKDGLPCFIGEIKHLGMLGEHSKRPKITRYARDFFRPFFVFSQHPRVLYFTDKARQSILYCLNNVFHQVIKHFSSAVKKFYYY